MVRKCTFAIRGFQTGVFVEYNTAFAGEAAVEQNSLGASLVDFWGHSNSHERKNWIGRKRQRGNSYEWKETKN